MCSTVLRNGGDYLVVTLGGSQSLSGDSPLTAIEVFNATSLTWEVWSNLTFPRVNSSCISSFGGVVVGQGSSAAALSVEYLDPGTGSTFLLPNLPTQCNAGVFMGLSKNSTCFLCPAENSTKMWVLEADSNEWQQAWSQTLANISSITKVDSTGNLFLSQLQIYYSQTISALYSAMAGNLAQFQCSVSFSCPVLLYGNTAWLCLFPSDTYGAADMLTNDFSPRTQVRENKHKTRQGTADWLCFAVNGVDALVFSYNPTTYIGFDQLLVGESDIVYGVAVLGIAAVNGSNGRQIWGKSISDVSFQGGIVGPNGALYALEHGSTNNIIAFDGASGEVIAKSDSLSDKYEEYVGALSMGDDGILYYYTFPFYSSNEIRIFDKDSLQSKGVIHISGASSVENVIATNDILYASDSSNVWAYDLKQQKQLWMSPLPAQFNYNYRLMTLNADSLYCCLQDRVVVVDVNTGEIQQTFKVACYLFAIHGDLLAIDSPTADLSTSSIVVYNVSSGALLWEKQFQSFYTNPADIAVGAGGTLFVSAEYATLAFDINTGVAKWGAPYGDGELAIGSDGMLYLSSSDLELYAFNSVAERWESSDVINATI